MISSNLWTRRYVLPFFKQQEQQKQSESVIMIRNIPLSTDTTSISLLDLKTNLSDSKNDQQIQITTNELIAEEDCGLNDSSSSSLLIPLTINHSKSTQSTNSYTVSPYNHFITYGWEELWSNSIHITFKLVLSIVLSILSLILKWTRFDQVVIAGNYMLSTSLHNGMNNSQIRAMTQYLSEQFPDRAIVIRSVNDSITNDLKERLQQCFGYKMIMSRVIYWSEPMERATLKEHRSLAQDVKLLQKLVIPFGPYVQTGLIDSREDLKPGQKYHHSNYKFQILDNKLLLQRARECATNINNNTDIVLNATNPVITQCEQLYNMLYLQKYSKCNVQFSSNFLLYALENNIWQFRALENLETGVIEGIIGYYILPYRSYNSQDELVAEKSVITVPLLGYDTKLDSEPLYRLLSSMIALEGAVNGAIVNQSSGASKFKMFRSCSKSIEYMAVYDRHLSWYRRLTWSFFNILLGLLAAPIVLKYDL